MKLGTLLECPKVLGFIGGTAEKPAPITQREADAILLPPHL